MSRYHDNRTAAVVAYPVALLSGYALSFAFPRHDWYLLAWFALVPLMWSCVDRPDKSAFKTGLLFGLGFFFGTQYWIYHSINHYGNVSFVTSLLLVLPGRQRKPCSCRHAPRIYPAGFRA